MAFLTLAFSLEAQDVADRAELLQHVNCLRESSREILKSVCEGYQIILPKVMGCCFFQFFHEIFRTDCFRHFQHRSSQIGELQKIFASADFNPDEAMDCLNAMVPFEGNVGKLFYNNCRDLLLDLMK